MTSARLALTYALMLAMGVAVPDACAIDDEIQVYTDDINKPRETGLELHINTTPSGRSVPNYPGDVPPYHGLRLTAEFSYGLARDFEAGMYIPTAWSAQGTEYLGGVKFRMKWLPVHPEDHGGWYAGGNVELSFLHKSFSDSPVSVELRGIAGYHDENWLLGFNPVLEWSLSPGYRGSPDAVFAYKIARTVVPDVAAGFEYYASVGKLSHPLPNNLQDHTLYLAFDVDHGPTSINFGVGRGLTSGADRWTVKAVIGFPLNW